MRTAHYPLPSCSQRHGAGVRPWRPVPQTLGVAGLRAGLSLQAAANASRRRRHWTRGALNSAVRRSARPTASKPHCDDRLRALLRSPACCRTFDTRRQDRRDTHAAHRQLPTGAVAAAGRGRAHCHASACNLEWRNAGAAAAGAAGQHRQSAPHLTPGRCASEHLHATACAAAAAAGVCQCRAQSWQHPQRILCPRTRTLPRATAATRSTGGCVRRATRGAAAGTLCDRCTACYGHGHAPCTAAFCLHAPQRSLLKPIQA